MFSTHSLVRFEDTKSITRNEKRGPAYTAYTKQGKSIASSLVVASSCLSANSLFKIFKSSSVPWVAFSELETQAWSSRLKYSILYQYSFHIKSFFPCFNLKLSQIPHDTTVIPVASPNIYRSPTAHRRFMPSLFTSAGSIWHL